MRNLELKVRCENEEKFRVIEWLAQEHGAIYMRTMKQRDTYFRVRQGRLKLREWWLEEPESFPLIKRSGHTEAEHEDELAGAELIYYKRPNKVGSRISDYDVKPELEPESLRSMLTKALRGTLVVVEKIRVLYEFGRTRIHLDTVKGLGTFVELETIIGKATSLEDAKTEHQIVITFLGLDILSPIASSYSDLLIHA
ncbi:MAG: hypothetical protein AUH89_04175 [Ktedonobacter sp. 13_1_40CM_4_52_4]|nr:MAG: hypothetical protein AUH89_04175 [Ktedonobacter sp. 13_1_40CM_4_52_4]